MTKKFILCLVLATFKEQVDKLNLVEYQTNFTLKMIITFTFLESLRSEIRDFLRKVIENAAVRRADILAFYIYIYILISKIHYL